MQLLALVFASTSLLRAFPGGPATETFTANTGTDLTITVDVALARAEGEVPVPIRITGTSVPVDVVICDGPSCTGAQAITVGVNAVVETVAVLDEGRPNLRLITGPGRHEQTCCQRASGGRTVAVIASATAVGADDVFASGRPTVNLVAVGRLFDDEPAQLGNVGAVVMRAGDLDHDEAFFTNLHRFAALGGLVSVDVAQGARLGLGAGFPAPSTSTTDLRALNLARYFGGGADHFDVAVSDNRSVGSFTLSADAMPALRGTVFLVDNGLIIVRDRDLDDVEAVADLVFARSSFLYDNHVGWHAGSYLTNALLVGLQPQPSPLPMVIWLVLTSIIAAIAARVAVRRRAGMAGPVLASLAVVVALAVSSAAAIALSFTSSSWRSAAVRVIGPGKTLHTRTLASARSPDFAVDLAAFRPTLDAHGRTFIADHRGGPRSSLGPDIAEVSIHTEVVAGGGHLLVQSNGTYTNHFDRPVTIHPASAAAVLHVAPGASVVADMALQGDDDVVPAHVHRVIDVLQQRCHCAIASFVDTDGVVTLAEGTFE